MQQVSYEKTQVNRQYRGKELYYLYALAGIMLLMFLLEGFPFISKPAPVITTIQETEYASDRLGPAVIISHEPKALSDIALTSVIQASLKISDTKEIKSQIIPRKQEIITISPSAAETAAKTMAESTVITTGESKSIENVYVVNVECSTQLRQDYCVGSTEAVPALYLEYVMSDGSRIKLEESEYTADVLDTSSPGLKMLSVHCGEHVIELPYQVVDYVAVLHLNGGNYEMESLSAYDYKAELPGNPMKIGFGKGKWYLDEACTQPLEETILIFQPGQTQMNLYAGYEVLGNFLLDEEGYVVGYEGVMTKSMMLPEYCVGVRKDAFINVDTSPVRYVYIPANVIDLEPGAFNGMTKIKDYLVISEENPVYCSINGMVMSKDKSILYVYPSGRKGEDYLPGTLRSIADYAFYGASISSLVFETDVPPIVEGSHCFAGCNASMMVPAGTLDAYMPVFCQIEWDGMVEEIE